MLRKGLFAQKEWVLGYFASIRWNAEVLICPLVLNFECLKVTSRSQSNFGEALIQNEHTIRGVKGWKRVKIRRGNGHQSYLQTSCR